MTKSSFDIIVVGAGVFGLTTAIELKLRGYQTALLDAGTIPHPLAASTDISKVIRLAYGKDEAYMALAELAIEGWRKWNSEFEKTLYHETGLAMFCQQKMGPGDFEYESFRLLRKRGHHPERMGTAEIIRRFPAWKDANYTDGFYHETGGYAESSKVISTLAEQAKRAGVRLIENFKVTQLLTANNKIMGVESERNKRLFSNKVVIAAGAWTPVLLPSLKKVMKASGHPVFHLKVKNKRWYQADNFPVFTADIAKTGWYGFPVHPSEQVVKVAVHAQGLLLDAEKDQRVVTRGDEANLKRFIQRTFPDLLDAKIVYTRRCLYCDTLDEHFLIDHHPEIQNLIIASGGSGHGFKFAPVLGPLIADAVEKKSNPSLSRFAWRDLSPDTKGKEASRFH